MERGVEDLGEERLRRYLRDADPADRADAWARLVDALGRTEASHRWLAVFAAIDAAET